MVSSEEPEDPRPQHDSTSPPPPSKLRRAKTDSAALGATSSAATHKQSQRGVLKALDAASGWAGERARERQQLASLQREADESSEEEGGGGEGGLLSLVGHSPHRKRAPPKLFEQMNPMTSSDRSYLDRLDAQRNVRLGMELAESEAMKRVQAEDALKAAEVAKRKADAAAAAAAAAALVDAEQRAAARAAAAATALRLKALSSTAARLTGKGDVAHTEDGTEDHNGTKTDRAAGAPAARSLDDSDVASNGKKPSLEAHSIAKQWSAANKVKTRSETMVQARNFGVVGEVRRKILERREQEGSAAGAVDGGADKSQSKSGSSPHGFGPAPSGKSLRSEADTSHKTAAARGATKAAEDAGTVASALREQRKETGFRRSRSAAAVLSGHTAQRRGLKGAGQEFNERYDPNYILRQIREQGLWATYKEGPKGEVESLRIRALAAHRGKAPPPGPRPTSKRYARALHMRTMLYFDGVHMKSTEDCAAEARYFWLGTGVNGAPK